MANDYYDPATSRDQDDAWSGGGTTGSATKESEGGVTQQAGEIAANAQQMAQDKIGEMGAMAQDRADAGIDRAAEGLQQAADSMRERFEEQDGVQAQVGTKVADGIEKTAAYLKEHDSAEMWGEIESFVKEHPLQACAGALVAGFFVGRMLR